MTKTEKSPQFQLPDMTLPTWVIDRTEPENLEDAGCGSRAALSTLHLMINSPSYSVSAELLGNHLAFESAYKSLKLQSRGPTRPELRDAYYLKAQLEKMGPAGRMFFHWRSVAAMGFHQEYWSMIFVDNAPTLMKPFMDPLFTNPSKDLISGNPMKQAIAWASRILSAYPKQQDIALQAADIALCRALRVPYVVPLFALHIKRKDIRALLDGDEIGFSIAMHRSVAHGAQDAKRLAHGLQRRAMHLKDVVPKLRAKGADKAVNLFLREHAVTPSTMSSPRIKRTPAAMTPRAARRLCDRLVELGVVKELTGRSRFRVYGMVP